MNSSNNLTGVFHLLIIASFLFSLSGCGYKAPPYYIEESKTQKSQTDDENVEFILKKDKSNNEN